MSSLDEWADALWFHDHPRRRRGSLPERRVPADRNDGATIIMWRYKNTCGECGGEEVMGGDDFRCPHCGVEFYFIRPSDEPLLSSDIQVIRDIAQATGLQFNG